AGEQDKLVEGRGAVEVKLMGADFEFLETAALESIVKGARPADVPFTLPAGKRGGPQDSVTVTIDTAKRGEYKLLLAQSDGGAHRLALIILPPNPTLTGLPIRLNLGEAHQAIRLQGNGLERVEGVSSQAGEIHGKVEGQTWSGEAALAPAAAKGAHFALQ